MSFKNVRKTDTQSLTSTYKVNNTVKVLLGQEIETALFT